MLEFEIAAIYYLVDKTIKATPYFEAVPRDMLTPCVFYPTPEQSGGKFSTSKYQTTFVMYVKFIAESTMHAHELANKVLHRIMESRRKVPLVDENGQYTGKNLHVDSPVVRKVDNGVYQMEISWKRYTPYNEGAVALAQEFFMNGERVS